MHNFFSNSQFGFSKDESTKDALIIAKNLIHSSLDNGYKVIDMFLDLKKAFDSVNHCILIKE